MIPLSCGGALDAPSACSGVRRRRFTELTSEFVDQFRVGKLNHFLEKEKQIDWPKFRGDAEVMLQLYGRQQTKEACGIGYLLDYQLTNAR